MVDGAVAVGVVLDDECEHVVRGLPRLAALLLRGKRRGEYQKARRGGDATCNRGYGVHGVSLRSRWMTLMVVNDAAEDAAGREWGNADATRVAALLGEMLKQTWTRGLRSIASPKMRVE